MDRKPGGVDHADGGEYGAEQRYRKQTCNNDHPHLLHMVGGMPGQKANHAAVTGFEDRARQFEQKAGPLRATRIILALLTPL